MLPRRARQYLRFHPRLSSEIFKQIQKSSMVHRLSRPTRTLQPVLQQDSSRRSGYEPFAVAEIMSLKLDQARFAYLSACYVASNSHSSLLDESIHVAGSCLLAGFPTVIGTLVACVGQVLCHNSRGCLSILDNRSGIGRFSKCCARVALLFEESNGLKGVSSCLGTIYTYWWIDLVRRSPGVEGFMINPFLFS